MKRAAILLLSVIFCMALFGCKPDAYEGEKNITVVIDMTAYEGELQVDEGVQEYEDKMKIIEIKTEALRLEEVLNELAKEGNLTFSGRRDIYGLFVTKIDNVEIDAITYTTGFFIYTNDEKYSSQQYGTYEYNDQTINSATFGVTDLPVKNGCIYAMVYTVSGS